MARRREPFESVFGFADEEFGVSLPNFKNWITEPLVSIPARMVGVYREIIESGKSFICI